MMPHQLITCFTCFFLNFDLKWRPLCQTNFPSCVPLPEPLTKAHLSSLKTTGVLLYRCCGVQPAPTIVDGFHSNACSILAITFLIKLDSGLTTMALRGVQCIQFTHMGTQLLHCAGTERVTRCNQHTESIFHQPKTDLKTQYTYQLAKSLLHQKKEKKDEKKGRTPTPTGKQNKRKTCPHDLHQLANKTYKQYTSISSPSPRSRSVHVICINWPHHSSTNKKQTLKQYTSISQISSPSARSRPVHTIHQSAKSVLHQPEADFSPWHTSSGQWSSTSQNRPVNTMYTNLPEKTCKNNVHQLAKLPLQQGISKITTKPANTAYIS